MEDIDDIITRVSEVEFDETSVNPNIVRPQDTAQLMREMAELPLFMRPVEQPPTKTTEA